MNRHVSDDVLVALLSFLWWFRLFDVAGERSARDPQCCTYLWNGMTLIGKHPPGQGRPRGT